jgi:hypothetical protein
MISYNHLDLKLIRNQLNFKSSLLIQTHLLFLCFFDFLHKHFIKFLCFSFLFFKSVKSFYLILLKITKLVSNHVFQKQRLHDLSYYLLWIPNYLMIIFYFSIFIFLYFCLLSDFILKNKLFLLQDSSFLFDFFLVHYLKKKCQLM